MDQEERVQTAAEMLIFRATLAGASRSLGRELRSEALMNRADMHSREVRRLCGVVLKQAAQEHGPPPSGKFSTAKEP